MTIKCPCIDCKDRRISPNCHDDKPDCPHGYRAWLAAIHRERDYQHRDSDAKAYEAEKTAILSKISRTHRGKK